MFIYACVLCTLPRFAEGEGKEADARRNKRFKLIPNIPQASLMGGTMGGKPQVLKSAQVSK